jgi:hypothetical protein
MTPARAQSRPVRSLGPDGQVVFARGTAASTSGRSLDLTLSSADVYRDLALALDPVFARSDMARVRRLRRPAWVARHGADAPSCFFSLKVDSKATDPFSGQGFRVELERSRQPAPGRGLNGQALFFQLLTDEEMAPLLAQQNAVIRSLPSPPAQQIDLYPAGMVRQQYLKYFQPQERFDVVGCWFRYRTDRDVATWGRLISPLATVLMERANALLEPDVLYPHQGSLVQGA